MQTHRNSEDMLPAQLRVGERVQGRGTPQGPELTLGQGRSLVWPAVVSAGHLAGRTGATKATCSEAHSALLLGKSLLR